MFSNINFVVFEKNFHYSFDANFENVQFYVFSLQFFVKGWQPWSTIEINTEMMGQANCEYQWHQGAVIGLALLLLSIIIWLSTFGTIVVHIYNRHRMYLLRKFLEGTLLNLRDQHGLAGHSWTWRAWGTKMDGIDSSTPMQITRPWPPVGRFSHDLITLKIKGNVNIKLWGLCESLIVYIVFNKFQWIHMAMAVNRPDVRRYIEWIEPADWLPWSK